MASNDYEKVIIELQEQTRWLRLIGLQSLRPILEQVLTTDKQRLVFEFSDGRRAARDVAREAGVGPSTVSRYWTEWIANGICAESPDVPGRARHLASLTSLGFEIPTSAPSTDAGSDGSPGQES